MTGCEIREMFRNLNTGKRNEIHAPHKPLLALFALAKFAQGEDQVSFKEAKEVLPGLIRRFTKATTGGKEDARHPFWHLCSDGVWRLEGAEATGLRPGQKPRLAIQRRKWTAYFRTFPQGGFVPEIQRRLKEDRSLVYEVANDVLKEYFSVTPALWHDIIHAVGLPAVELPFDLRNKRQEEARNSDFRRIVLENYRHRCSLCEWPGLSLGKRNSSPYAHGIGLEAAQIKPHAQGGPAVRENGLALCANHHKLFDYGAFTVDEGLVIEVSSEVEEIYPGCENLVFLAGKRIVRPRCDPDPEFLEWRKEAIFREPALVPPR